MIGLPVHALHTGLCLAGGGDFIFEQRVRYRSAKGLKLVNKIAL
jgi:hypothetical protein